MYWLIEDLEKINILTSIKLPSAYVEVISYSPFTHPVENQVLCLYVKPTDGSKGYMVNCSHSEALSIPFENLNKLIDSIEKIYVIDKKEFLHYFYHKNIISLNLLNHSIKKESTPTHEFFYNKYSNHDDVNNIIPIVKHYESCEANFKSSKSEFDKPINRFYNDKVTIVFNAIESNGIKIDPILFKQYFEVDKHDRAYTQYNLTTTTTRPSNNFGGINYATLKKDNGERKCFIPNNDFFIEMDISAMHPTILANLLGYTFSSDDVHQSFAEMYRVDYSTAKEITFKQMYGGVWKEYEHLEFFQKVKEYTNQIWEEYNTQGYILSPVSSYRFEKNKLEDMNPQKLLNYVLQNLETSINTLILWKIFKLLRTKNTKLVLYVYDSFLFDVDKTEKDTIKQILQIFDQYKLKVKFKKGTNYNFN